MSVLVFSSSDLYLGGKNMRTDNRARYYGQYGF